MQSTRAWGAMGALCALCGVVAWSCYGSVSEPAHTSSVTLYVPQMTVPKVRQMPNVPQPVPQREVPKMHEVPQVAQPVVREVSEMPQVIEMPSAMTPSALVDQAQPRRPDAFAPPIAEASASPLAFLGGLAGGLAAGGALAYSLAKKTGQKVSVEAKNLELGNVARAGQPQMVFTGFGGSRAAPPTPEPVVPEQPEFLTTVQDIFITVLRLGTCALMVHHGFDKIQNVDGFSANVVAKFFGFLPGPPYFWTYSAAATQIAGAGLLAVGVLSRPVAASMATTMVVAVIFHLLNTGPEDFPLGIPKAHSYNFELAAMYVLVLGYFTVSGAGKFSVDEQVLGGELNFYSGLLDKVRGRSEEE